MMTDEAGEPFVGPENEANPVGEARGPTGHKRKQVSWMEQEGQGESRPEAWAKAKGARNDVLGGRPDTRASVSHHAPAETTGSGQGPPAGSSPKCVLMKLKRPAGDRVAPSPLGSVSADPTRVSKAALLLNPGGIALGGGIVSSDLAAGDSNVTAVPPPAVAPNALLGSPEALNADIKRQLMKEIRRFGRNYERIFTLLEEVHGPLEVKKQLVEFTIKEAARFKRRDLIKHLEKILEKIASDNLLDKDNQTPNK